MYTEHDLQTKITSPAVRKRIRMEQEVIGKLLDVALERGYVVSVNDGEEWTLIRSRDKKAICDALMTTDQDRLMFGKVDGGRIGTVDLIYGNDGFDVIADYSDNSVMNKIMELVQPTIDKLAG